MAGQKRTKAHSRSIMLRVRVNPAEKNSLEQKAKEAELSLSDWVRSRAIGAKPLTRKASPDREVLLRILAALGKTGSNLNQVARQLNRKQENFEFDVPVREIMRLLDELKEISEQLRASFYGGHKG